ncbi:MAG: LTA synthase family protein [Desulfobacterales bacterium]|jgi:hypothetical protein|nr:LTA synthase family protein [Desulfobacterales bacterium]
MKFRTGEKSDPAPGSTGGRPPWPGAAAGILFLNAVLNAEALAAGPAWLLLLRPAPELLAILAGICLFARKETPFRRTVYIPLTVLILFFGLFRAADGFISAVFFRPLNLAMDTPRLPDLLLLARMLFSPGRLALVLAGVAVCAAAAAWGVRRALAALHDLFTSLALTAPAKPLAAGVFLVAALAGPQLSPTVVGMPTLPRLIEELRFLLDLDGVRRQDLAAIAAARERACAHPTQLQRLGRTTVLLFVVESYGRAAFSHPGHSARILPAIKSVEAELGAAGFLMGSQFLDAPTVGGGSWLTHATLASGVRVASQIRHDLLLASDLTPLAAYFNRAGYRTLRAMPGTLWPWPSGEFYRYEQTFIAPDFDYRGPRFAFAPMPDQFVLEWMWQKAIARETRPLFVEFILVSSHTGFEVHAPYVEDWGAIGDGSLFESLPPLVLSGVWFDPDALSAAYGTAIRYEWAVLKEFIRRRVAADELVIILGDHQPPGPAAGEDRSSSVPIHIITRNAEALGRFLERGYTKGLVPDQPLPHPGLETFFWDFLEDFSG